MIITSNHSRAFHALMLLAGEKQHSGDHSMKTGTRPFKSRAPGCMAQQRSAVFGQHVCDCNLIRLSNILLAQPAPQEKPLLETD